MKHIVSSLKLYEVSTADSGWLRLEAEVLDEDSGKNHKILRQAPIQDDGSLEVNDVKAMLFGVIEGISEKQR